MEKMRVDVYAGINAGGGCCSAGCSGCGPADVKGEYDHLKELLDTKYQDVDCSYIDTTDQSLDNYPEIAAVIDRGYSFPLTAVNGTLRLAGRIAPDAVMEILDEEKAMLS